MTPYHQLETNALTEIKAAKDLPSLDAIKVKFLGKKGAITDLMKDLGRCTPEERKEKGQALNVLKQKVGAALDEKKTALETAHINARLAEETLDLTLPGRTKECGTLHPISHVIEEVICLFGEMGFILAEGPDIEEDYYNFEAVNIPPEHPARQEQDTFYLPDNHEGKKMVLRTHTSPVQIRTMLKEKPPIQIISTGRVFRSDYDMTHTPMFHQVEGLLVAENIHMGHLKGCLTTFLEAFFDRHDLPIRLRPSYFPFTEPSAEVDIGCSRSADGSFSIGHGDDWLEILGCGMVHPKVLENGGIDPKKYQGFAFGMGIERIAMLKYGIPDLRTFFEVEAGWQRHYSFETTAFPSLLTGLHGGLGR